MCGLVAILGDGAPVRPDDVRRALRRMGHRGPDGQGVWTDQEGRIGLGHTRLSVTGSEQRGAQPIADETGAVVAVVNGEFYGFERIRRELEGLGHAFRTDSDSEILVHLYQDLGPAALESLRGEFAFALWDGDRRRLFAARDRFGIKPLFYALQGRGLAMASEVKALFAAGVEAGWALGPCLEHLFMVHGQAETMFQGVAQVPPGHFLEAGSGRVHVRRYWDLDFPTLARAERPVDEPELVERVRRALVEAVRVRATVGGRIGCFLSGGVDSATVLSMAPAETPVRAFTVTFEDAVYDEGAVARLVAERAGAEYEPVRLTHAEIAEAFPAAVFHAESVGNMHGVARFVQSRRAHESGCKVALTGDGGDEVFAGYSHFRLDVGPERGAPVPRALDGVRARLGFVPAWMLKLASERAVFHTLVSPNVWSLPEYERVYDRFLDHVDVGQGCEGRHPLLQSMYVWSKTMLPNYSLCADRLEMAHSVECRHPLLDHRLFEEVRRAPVDCLIRGGSQKYLLREAAKPWLPSRVHSGPKHPFTVPPATADLDGPVMTLIEDQLRSRAMNAVPLFDHSAVVTLLDEVRRLPPGRRVAYEPILMILLCTSLLQQQYRL